MAKKISPQDLFTEVDIFKGIRASADKTIKELNEMQGVLKKTATTLKESIGNAKFDTTKGIKQFTTQTKEALKVTQEFEKTQKAAAVAEQQRQKALQQAEITAQRRNKTKETEINLSRKQQQEQERLNKQKLKAKKLAQDETNAYKKLVKSTRDLKNESKRLGAEMLILEQKGKKNSAEYRKLATQYNQVTSAAKRGDAQLKKLDKTVGDNFRNVGNYRAGLGKLTAALGTLGVAFGIAGTLRNVMGTIVGFDQAVADLAAISGQTKEQIKGLNDQAKELGATTQFTAIEITNMQIELAKLGFTNDQISQSTEAVANFAAATGADIPAAAKVAGSALRGFNLDASEMDRVVSTLAVATTKSALSFESFETGLSTIAPVAASFGFSIEDTTALLGQLANAGFDASSAATATRNILLNMADSSGDLAVALGRPIKNADDLAAGLQELEAKGVDLAEALELTDKRSVAAFNTFLKGSDNLVEFRDSITDVNDELEEMARKRLDSVQGQLTLLSSAWDGFVISMGESISASQGLKTTLSFLAENLELIMSTIGKLIRAFIVYKGTLMALRVAQRLYNTDFSSLGKQMAAQIPMTRAYRLEQIKMTRGTKQASAAVKGFGKAFASIAIFAIIMAITELATAWYDVASGARAARLEEEARNEAAEIAAISKENQDKTNELRMKKNNDLLEARLKLIDDQLRKDKLLAKNREEEGDLEVAAALARYKEVVKARDKLRAQEGLGGLNLKERIGQLELTKIPASESQLKIDTQLADYYTSIFKQQEEHLIGGAKDQAIANMKQAKIAVANTTAMLNAQRSEVESLKTEQNSYNELVEEYWLLYQETQKAEKKGTEDKAKNNKVSRKQNVLLRERNRYLSRQRELLQDITEIEQDRELLGIEKQIEKELNLQLKAAKETGKFETEEINRLMKFKLDKQIETIDQRVKFEQESLDIIYDREKQKRQEDLDTAREQKVKEAKEKGKSVQKVNDFFDKQQENLDDDEILREQDKTTEKVKIFEDGENQKLEAQEEYMEGYEDNLEELNDAEETFTNSLIEKYRSQYETINQIVQMATDYFIKQSQRKIDQIDKEISAAQKQYDYFQQLAIKGNINAEQSLAEQQKIIDEANQRKLKQEQFQARIQLASSAYQTYNQKLADNKENALAETITDITLLQSFINSLPTFFEGTEDTGTNGRGIDGRGGFQAVLHPNERVIPKHLNENLKGITNEELTNMAVQYKINKSVGEYVGADQLTSGYEFYTLGSKLDKLTRVIEQKPETNIALGEITNSVMEIVKSTKTGNTILYNKYKVKK
jgi:TP901 family phage tail tape measure protein